MQLQSKYNIFVILIRWIIAIVFLYAGTIKILDPTGFVEDIDNYQILPYILVTLMAVILPWIEVITALCLMVAKWLKGASLLIILMNLIFIIAISSAMIRGLDIGCGCFSQGDESARVGLQKLGEDTLLLLGGILIYLKETGKAPFNKSQKADNTS